MTSEKKERFWKVQNVLKSFINNFQKNSIDYLYEEDLRAELYFLLKQKLQEDLLFDKISRVKTEYHCSPNCKIDISLLENLSNLRLPFEKKEHHIFELYKQKVEIGIEIKYQPVYTDQFGTFKKDAEKLEALFYSNKKSESIDTGIALLFFQIQEDFDKVKNLYAEYSNSELQVEANCVNKIIISPRNILFSSTS